MTPKILSYAILYLHGKFKGKGAQYIAMIACSIANVVGRAISQQGVVKMEEGAGTYVSKIKTIWHVNNAMIII